MFKKLFYLLAIISCSFIPTAPAYAQPDEMEPEELLFIDIGVITASKVSEKLSDAPGVITVMTKDEIERFGGTTLIDILEHVPGLMKTTMALADRTMVAIRGAQFKENSEHVLLLINGRPMRGEALEGGIITEILETFPVNIIEKIEVIKGPSSVLYGSGAFSGVVNIITEKANENGVALTAYGGNSGASNVSGKFKYRKDDLGLVVAAKYRQKPDWGVDYDVRMPPNTLVRKNPTIVEKGPGTYGEIHLKNFRFMTGTYNYDSMYFIPDVPFLFTDQSGYGKVKLERKWSDVGYSLQATEKWKMDFNVTLNASKAGVSDFPSFSRDSYMITGEWTNYISAIDRMGILFGGSYNYANGQEINISVSPNSTLTNHDKRSYCIYSQLDYWITPYKIKVIGGAQYNKSENTDADTVPRLGLIYYPISEINVKALYSQAFRAPSINENYLNNPSVRFGNINLKSEKVDTAEVAVTYFKKRGEIGISYFNSSLKNLIIARRSVSTGADYYNNATEIDQKGIELEGKYYVTDEFLVVGSVLNQQNKDMNGDENVSPTPQTSGKIGVSYKSDNGATLSLHNSYQGALDDKYATAYNVSPEKAYNIASLHGRFDMARLAGWKIANGFSFLLQVDNLFDKILWQPTWGVISGASLPFNQGRVVYAGVEISL